MDSRRRRNRAHYRGCLLGGAVGDALGAAIEFDSLSAIRARFGPAGLTDYAEAYGRLGAITDDTQMTLFTAEGLIRADNRAHERGICGPADVVWHAYLRWLHTQSTDIGGAPWHERMAEPGWLVADKRLHSRRAPGNTCTGALRHSLRTDGRPGAPDHRINNSKGCGGVMRIAPVGLSPLDPLEQGCAFAALTHCHPSGFWAAGYFALIVRWLAEGEALRVIVERLVSEPPSSKEARETIAALDHALQLGVAGDGTAEELEELGQGWVAEEALAIGVYAALRAEELAEASGEQRFAHGVLLAVNHSGDSDSTGSVAGNLLGLIHGAEAIPARWLERLELADLITELADDLWLHFGEGEKPADWVAAREAGRIVDWDKYPGN